MPNARTTLASALASASVLFIAWQSAGGAIGTTQHTAVTTTATGTTRARTVQSPSNTQADSGRTSPDQTTQTATEAVAAAYKDGSYTGQTASSRFGSITVTVTVSGGKITDVSAEVLSDGDHHSDQINGYSIPQLREAVIAANSAQVDTIGGATYTSESYLTSLQSALDQAA